MSDQLPDIIEELRGLMASQLRIKGKSLRAQVRRAGRLLPRAVRREAWFLIETAELAENPKLARMVDHARVAQAHQTVLHYLNSRDPARQRINNALNFLASIALVLIVVFAVVLYVLVQRGFI